jgi:aspartyl-tRNA(Asn)/glutamyl-tRNA(Gln) amidotransferase subunit B
MLRIRRTTEVKKKPKTPARFAGQVTKATGGRANPGAVNEILKKKLEVAE